MTNNRTGHTAPGRDLERIVAAIERALNNVPDVQIETRKRLRDKDTGRLREHDVVVTLHLRHLTSIFAIECRDQSRQVGVPQVEQFSNKCRRTGINKPIMVSSNGFTHTAIQKAEAEGVTCLRLDQVETFDWLATGTIEYGERDLIAQDPWEVVGTEEPYSGTSQILDRDGKPLGAAELSRIAHGYLAMRPFELAIQEDNQARQHPVTHRTTVDMPDMYLRANGGKLVRITRLIAPITYKISPQTVPLALHEYRNQHSGELLAATAIGRVTGAAGEADVVLHREGDQLRITFIPQPRAR